MKDTTRTFIIVATVITVLSIMKMGNAHAFFDKHANTTYVCAGITETRSIVDYFDRRGFEVQPVERKVETHHVYVNYDNVIVGGVTRALRPSKTQTVFAGQETMNMPPDGYFRRHKSEKSFLFNIDKKTLTVIDSSNVLTRIYESNSTSEFNGTCQKK